MRRLIWILLESKDGSVEETPSNIIVDVYLTARKYLKYKEK